MGRVPQVCAILRWLPGVDAWCVCLVGASGVDGLPIRPRVILMPS